MPTKCLEYVELTEKFRLRESIFAISNSFHGRSIG
jgi:hypothetical protein